MTRRPAIPRTVNAIGMLFTIRDSTGRDSLAIGRAVHRLAERRGVRVLGTCEAMHLLAPQLGGAAGLEAAIRRELDKDVDAGAGSPRAAAAE